MIIQYYPTDVLLSSFRYWGLVSFMLILIPEISLSTWMKQSYIMILVWWGKSNPSPESGCLTFFMRFTRKTRKRLTYWNIIPFLKYQISLLLKTVTVILYILLPYREIILFLSHRDDANLSMYQYYFYWWSCGYAGYAKPHRSRSTSAHWRPVFGIHCSNLIEIYILFSVYGLSFFKFFLRWGGLLNFFWTICWASLQISSRLWLQLVRCGKYSIWKNVKDWFLSHFVYDLL